MAERRPGLRPREDVTGPRLGARPRGEPRGHIPPSRSRAVLAARDTRSLRLSGTLMVCAGVAILMGIITAEALFPGAYNTSQNQISDLGSTWNPGGIVKEPSATIFNATMLVTGLMIAASAGLLYRATARRGLGIAVGALGLGILLVGIFHGEMVNGHFSSAGVHPIVAMVAFIAGPTAALLSSRIIRGPFGLVAAALGLVGLISVLLSGPLGDTGLGEGGIERWIAYPTVLWLVAFGGYLLAARPQDLRRSTSAGEASPPEPTG
jgi:hypothetical membrane protein